MSKHDPAIIKQRSLTPEGELPEGLASYGHPVPAFRKASALRHYRDMNPSISTEDATLDIDKLSNFIERDQPYEAEAYWRQVMHGGGYAKNPRRALDLTARADDLMRHPGAVAAALDLDEQRLLGVHHGRDLSDALEFVNDRLQLVFAAPERVRERGGVERAVEPLRHVGVELDPAGSSLVELRMRLLRANRPITETWLYRWTAS